LIRVFERFGGHAVAVGAVQNLPARVIPDEASLKREKTPAKTLVFRILLLIQEGYQDRIVESAQNEALELLDLSEVL
jgi:hypothetical protein